MHNMTTRIPSILLTLLLSVTAAMASTEVILGTILTVAEDGASFTVHVEMYNYTSRGEGRNKRLAVREKSIIWLDGKESSAEEAIKPGRAVMYQSHGAYILVSSASPGPDAVRTADDPANAIHRITVGKVLVLPVKAKRGVNDVDVGIELVLDVVDGAVTDGVAIYTVSTWPNVDIDVSGLVCTKGVITGTTSVTIDHPAVQKDGPITVALALGTGGADQRSDGLCTATVDGKAVQRGCTRQVLPRADHAVGKAWMRLGAPGVFYRDHVFVVFSLVDGKGQTDGHHWTHKGGVNGSIQENGLTLADGKLTGELKSMIKARGESVPHRFVLDARVLGGRYLFGTLRVTVAGATRQGFVRGGVVPADHPVTGVTAEMAALYKERFPKKKRAR